MLRRSVYDGSSDGDFETVCIHVCVCVRIQRG